MSPLLSFMYHRLSPSPRGLDDLFFEDMTFPHVNKGIKFSKMEHLDQASPPHSLTLVIPDQDRATAAAYCTTRRPNLQEVLNNESSPPWTLSAFMAYLSHNHCLETLEFTMDAKRYRQHYEKATSKAGGQLLPGTEPSIHMSSLWHRLTQTYILPNGPREVNLPSNVKHALLMLGSETLAPHPDMLNVAISKVYELMEESVLVPFLNSLAPQSTLADSNSSSMEDLGTMGDERAMTKTRPGRSNRNRGSLASVSPPPFASTPATSVVSPPAVSTSQYRASAPSAIAQFARSFSNSRHTVSIPHSSAYSSLRPLSGPGNLSQHSVPSTSHSPILELGVFHGNSTPSPTPTYHDETILSLPTPNEPMTPPTTPPTTSLDTSPPLSAAFLTTPERQITNPWKRMCHSFGRKKKNDANSDCDHIL